jgi:hypothetical protein
MLNAYMLLVMLNAADFWQVWAAGTLVQLPWKLVHETQAAAATAVFS